MSPPEITRRRVREVLRDHQEPLTLDQVAGYLGVAPTAKGSRGYVRSVLSGMCIANQARFVPSKVRGAVGTYEYVGEPYSRSREEYEALDAVVTAYLEERGPSTMLDMADDLGLYPHTVRRALLRIGATAPDEKPKRWRLERWTGSPRSPSPSAGRSRSRYSRGGRGSASLSTARRSTASSTS